MKDHASAIAFFTEHGYVANQRSWALGDTVVVGIKDTPSAEGVAVLSFVLWLVPNEPPAWDVVSTVYMHERRLTFATLRVACEAALKQLRLQVIEQACPSCGGRRELRFGERIFETGNRWYESTSCRDCRAMTEADGGGELPDDLRAIEFARNGRWRVAVESPATTVDWRAMRDLLGLDLAATAALKKRVPGVVAEGTFAHAVRIRDLFARNGASAGLSEIDPPSLGQSITAE